MSHPVRMDSMWAFVMIDEDGTEGIPAYRDGDEVVPMIACDEDRVTFLRTVAADFVAQYRQPLTLVRFTAREDVETVGGDEPS